MKDYIIAKIITTTINGFIEEYSIDKFGIFIRNKHEFIKWNDPRFLFRLDRFVSTDDDDDINDWTRHKYSVTNKIFSHSIVSTDKDKYLLGLTDRICSMKLKINLKYKTKSVMEMLEFMNKNIERVRLSGRAHMRIACQRTEECGSRKYSSIYNYTIPNKVDGLYFLLVGDNNFNDGYILSDADIRNLMMFKNVKPSKKIIIDIDKPDRERGGINPIYCANARLHKANHTYKYNVNTFSWGYDLDRAIENVHLTNDVMMEFFKLANTRYKDLTVDSKEECI